MALRAPEVSYQSNGIVRETPTVADICITISVDDVSPKFSREQVEAISVSLFKKPLRDLGDFHVVMMIVNDLLKNSGMRLSQRNLLYNALLVQGTNVRVDTPITLTARLPYTDYQRLTAQIDFLTQRFDYLPLMLRVTLLGSWVDD